MCSTVFWDVLTCSTVFWDVLVCSTVFWDELMCSTVFWDMLMCSTVFWDVLTCSTVFWNVLMCSTVFWDVLMCSAVFWNVLTCSKKGHRNGVVRLLYGRFNLIRTVNLGLGEHFGAKLLTGRKKKNKPTASGCQLILTLFNGELLDLSRRVGCLLCTISRLCLKKTASLCATSRSLTPQSRVPLSEANGSSANQQIRRILRKPEFPHCFHNSPPHVHILSQISPCPPILFHEAAF